MIREIIRPQQNQITVNIPDDYIDKEIEFIAFPINNNKTIKTKRKKSLRGVFNKYADISKISLEDNAWQNCIVNKFKQND